MYLETHEFSISGCLGQSGQQGKYSSIFGAAQTKLSLPYFVRALVSSIKS